MAHEWMLDEDLAAELGIRQEPGWIGSFTRGQAPGAIPNGTRIVKVQAEPGDRNPVGTMGTVLGSLFSPLDGYAYFVEWDSMPRVAISVIWFKIDHWRPS